MRSRLHGTVRRAGATVAAVVFAAGLISTAPAARAGGSDGACPAGRVPEAGFDDVDPADVHASAIDCVVWWGLSIGTTRSTYDPDAPVSQAQWAAILDRFVVTAGGSAAPTPAGMVADHTSVTRGRAAGELVRLVRDVFGRELPGRGAVAGPARLMTRGEMASSVMRAVDVVMGGRAAARAGRVAPTAGRGSGGDYEAAGSENGLENRWQPCRAITYVVNATHGTPDSLADAREAVRRVATASGLTFEYRGTTGVIPDSAWAQTGAADLIIAWADADQTDLFEGYDDDTVGVGWHWYDDGGPYNRIRSAAVVISAEHRDSYPGGFGRRSAGQLLMHELGHTVGLDHATRPEQLMFPSMTGNPATWGAGDLTGLRRHGRGDAVCGAEGLGRPLDRRPDRPIAYAPEEHLEGSDS